MSLNRISIIINNYNYARFLETAIESAIHQDEQPHEVIVVDDGSTDTSSEVLERYASRVKVIKKSNGGQASAFNEGYRIATGEWIWFVDADDFLLPNAVRDATIAAAHGVSKIHSPLFIVRYGNEVSNQLHPGPELSVGNVVDEILMAGDYKWPPTTGNIFHRSMMEKCMPVPEDEYRLSADFYLCSFAPFAGSIVQTASPVGCYRIHGNNGFFGFSFEKKRLKRLAEITLLSTNRMQQLVRKFTELNNWTYPFGRRTLESLVISKRFGDGNMPNPLSGLRIHKKWWNSSELQNTSVKTKLTALVFWAILNFAPKPIAAYFIKKGINKGRAHNP